MPFDQIERLRRVEAALDDQRLTHRRGHQRVQRGRSMVHGRGDQVRSAAPIAVEGRESLHVLDHLFGGACLRTRLEALGSAGGPGGVGHRDAAEVSGRPDVELSVEPVVEHVVDRQHPLDAGLGRGRLRALLVLGVAAEQARGAVAQDVDQLVVLQMVVEWDEHRARANRAEVDDQPLRGVAAEDRDSVAHAQSERADAVGEARGQSVELAEGPRSGAIDETDRVGGRAGAGKKCLAHPGWAAAGTGGSSSLSRATTFGIEAARSRSSHGSSSRSKSSGSGPNARLNVVAGPLPRTNL